MKFVEINIIKDKATVYTLICLYKDYVAGHFHFICVKTMVQV